LVRNNTNSTYRDEDSAVTLDKWIAYENEQAAGSSSNSAGDSTGARSEYGDDVSDDNECDNDEADQHDQPTSSNM
jgi:hypothetical protein